MVMQRQSQVLREAMRYRQLVRFERRFEAGFVRGYVLDVGPRFFLLSLVSDRVRFDGFECFRISRCKEHEARPIRCICRSRFETTR